MLIQSTTARKVRILLTFVTKKHTQDTYVVKQICNATLDILVSKNQVNAIETLAANRQNAVQMLPINKILLYRPWAPSTRRRLPDLKMWCNIQRR